MKYLILLISILFTAACASVPQKTDSIKVFPPSSIQSQNAAGQRILTDLPLSLENGMIMLGQNLILQFFERDENYLAIYLSVINPKTAKTDFYFDAPSRLNAAALNADGTWQLLRFIEYPDSRVLLSPMSLEPGQSKSGVLFLENKKAPQYKITLVNNDEVFEFTFDARQAITINQ